MNPRLAALNPYPFERLRALFEDVRPPSDREPINLGIGEPKQAPPDFVLETIHRERAGFARYPTTGGTRGLQEACARWAEARFHLPGGGLEPGRNVIPVNGTREALFGVAQAVVGAKERPVVAMPNPLYQIYEGAALFAGAEPVYVAAGSSSGLPDFAGLPASVLDRTELLYICSPGNPTGAVVGHDQYRELLRLADQHDFLIAADECYSEIYPDETDPPVGLLEVAAAEGRSDFRRCLAFHSLSKRSNLPGLRSGFVAGDAAVIEAFLKLRTYLGNATPPPLQEAAVAAWSDEAHVRENRAAYRERFARVLEILGPALDVEAPAGGFYLWPRVPGGGEQFAKELYAREGITVLPGAYLGREVEGQNPGTDHVRIALVDGLERCEDAAWRIRRVAEALQ
ncbi:succinyldiaminopimelate transaminase [Thiohalorhabdus methylotrophus]|uniref:Succinyldiaminopimelate transaminase n=1 Tax=Thiohalorhabdus methylotrophus TaxID=3242694 RepID=A0ABV4U0H7_9GAMM